MLYRLTLLVLISLCCLACAAEEDDSTECVVGPRGWCYAEDLSNAELRGADLRKAYLVDAVLTNADLAGADLEDAVLYRADLSGADLTGANLAGADLRRTNLRGADLTGATVSGRIHEAYFDDTTVWPAAFDIDNAIVGYDVLEYFQIYFLHPGADLRHAHLADADLSGLDLSGADMTRADLTGVTFEGTDFTCCTMKDVQMSEDLTAFRAANGHFWEDCAE